MEDKNKNQQADQSVQSGDRQDRQSGNQRHQHGKNKGRHHHGKNRGGHGKRPETAQKNAESVNAQDNCNNQNERVNQGKQGGRNLRHQPKNDKPREKDPAASAPAAKPENAYVPVPEKKEERVYRFDYDETPKFPVNDEPKTIEVVGIKFRGGSKVYYFDPIGIRFSAGEHAVVETVRGVEYGYVSCGNKMVGESEVVQPLKPVLRKATREDDQRNEMNRALEEQAKPVWHEKVTKNGLEMQLVDVEYTHDNSKLCFYFTADGRVDFRELVKDLAGVFRTRIELRQIGVRDEAKLCGGLGSCGRPFCCATFLPDFAQVSIKMAKEQNLSLSSTKISGSCGRLMCCLRFEHDTYEREYANFPKADTIVDTPKGRGVITESNFLSGKIKVRMNSDQSIKTFEKGDLKTIGTVKVKEQISDDLKKLEE